MHTLPAPNVTTAPAPKDGYVPTGRGRFAECPDHGVMLWWDGTSGVFRCLAEDHGAEAYVLDPRDIYLEHDEDWRTVAGALWVDEYEPVDVD